jgi:hypothetical protein
MDFNETWIFSTDFRKNTEISDIRFHENLSSTSEVVDGRTQMTKLIVAFLHFCERT